MISPSARIHFVGVGGAGMSALAEVMLRRGHEVSGCDVRESEATRRVRSLGGRVFIGHDPIHLDDADVVVVSRAIALENGERQAAARLGLRTLHRAELLGYVMSHGRGIAVVGTHGKTTTAAMLARVLTGAGLDPTALIGAEVAEYGGGARVGGGEWVVAEVDESDGSLLHVVPFGVVLTSLDETDHRDFYSIPGHLEQTFSSFLERVPSDGFIAACVDHPGVCAITDPLRSRTVTYGFGPRAHVRGEVVEMRGERTRSSLWIGGSRHADLCLSVPGRHNVSNALGAIAAASEAGISPEQALSALAGYRGAGRRFTIHGEANGVLVADDYAHNPVKIAAALRAAREGWPDRRLVALFQPHRYSRTGTTYAEYGRAFDPADEVVVTEIYAAGEKPIPGVSARLIVEAVSAHRSVHFCETTEAAVLLVERLASPGTIVLTLGAGDIGRAAEALLDRFASGAGGDG